MGGGYLGRCLLGLGGRRVGDACLLLYRVV
jgi:hypothetical protein